MGTFIEERAAMPELMTPAQFGKLASMSEQTVRRLCRDGVIPAAKVGGKWMIGTRKALKGAL